MTPTSRARLFPTDRDAPTRPDLAFEHDAHDRGYDLVAGLDEAGRGPLAGPVVAAAVRLPRAIDPASPLWRVRDSKTVPEKERQGLYEAIVAEALDLAWALCPADRIDAINIHVASLEAMADAALALEPRPDFCLVDGLHRLPGSLRSRPIVRGDQRCLSIAAASIIAKVVRDRIMRELHRRHPVYGFDRNKGYPTRQHRQALADFGPCAHHRQTYKGVQP